MTVTRATMWLPLALWATSARADGGGSAATVNGLYPLWETTGRVHALGAVEVGYGHAQIGLGRVQIGTQPFLDVYGVYNGELKLALWRGDRVQVALSVGAFHVPTAAETRGIGNLHASGFANPYAPVWLVPIALARSATLGSRWALHWTTTALLARSDDPRDTATSFGQTLLVEAFATRQWSARAHAGVEGIWVDPQGHAGLSFGYRSEHVALQAGYARRVDFDGNGAGVLMFDGALLFR